ncbi:uncharacterized protein LOC114534695 [Dendronephthya gigantea]|uniref:uncharacterized protein LOC114534695 n=1 Tax=Dendronephthya gigantea TaxID=151771 RepID=UPI0010692DE6|nr:uncharacterized protein LOC114534695 [Dendronephthya gigantea]
MVMSRCTAVGSIVTGCIMLGFAIITVICGAVSASKLSGEIAATAGLWSLYYAVPGILTIVAGATKRSVVMGFALFFNIIAVIVSLGASVALTILTILLNEVKDENLVCVSHGDTCTCSDSVSWNMHCEDFDTIHILTIVCLVFFIILTITTFTASIFGCLGTCCAPTDPIVVVTAGDQPPGGTVVVASNQSSSFQHGYPGGMPPAYGYGQPQEYGDKKGLVNNMVI